MRDNYDFSDAIKNPFAGRVKGKYKVTINYDFSVNEQSNDNKVNTNNSKSVRKPKSQQVVG